MRKAIFAIIPALLLLLLGELSTRALNAEDCKAVTPQAGDWETMIGDPHLLWKLEPNTEFKTGKDVTRINAVGLRESLSPTQKKRPQEKRILVTGDSSIYGWGVRDHETYAVFLEKELRRRWPTPFSRW